MPKILDRLTANDLLYMPVKAETKYYSDGNMPPTLTPFHVVTSKDGEILAQCDSREYADYIQDTMNFHYYSRRMMDVYDKIKDDVVGTIILDGEVVPKMKRLFRIWIQVVWYGIVHRGITLNSSISFENRTVSYFNSKKMDF